ncbi:hypothetical protein AGMMS49983_21540 [Clostridia bacterium]|nr:hypothetical protein AGMMS49983_21540 [Clostridia bacterium]
MSDVYWTDAAKENLNASIECIERYFIERGAIELISGQTNQFLSTLNAKIELLKENPCLYSIRQDYEFYGGEYRSFSAYWFTVFYQYFEDKDIIIILYIRSSKSDFVRV